MIASPAHSEQNSVNVTSATIVIHAAPVKRHSKSHITCVMRKPLCRVNATRWSTL